MGKSVTRKENDLKEVDARLDEVSDSLLMLSITLNCETTNQSANVLSPNMLKMLAREVEDIRKILNA